MKIDRLIGILSILLQEEKITAPELAERFEVSRRTINRDIEDLCKAGIPIKTAQGTGGGISIMDGYRMDRTILSSKDMQMILAGLRSLDSVSGSRYYSQLMEKIQTGSSEFISGRDSMLIDLSSWYKGSLAPKIEVIQSAIESRRIIRFEYYAPSGESNRRVEPYYLVFRWSSWYVWGWCLERKDYRLFKLNRMDCVVETDRGFLCRDVPMPDLSNEKIFPGGIKVKALFTPNMKWRLVEEFGPNCFTETDDGRLLFSADYTDMENLVTWLMTFGAKVEVLEPEEARDIIRRNADGEYKLAIGLLYGIAFTIKMSKKEDHQIDGYFDYVVPPLEGFWWQDGVSGIDYARKEDFKWISVIRLPDFVTREDFDWAVRKATAKKKQDFSKVEFFPYEEGLCVQCMHIGAYDDEPATVDAMHRFMEEQGYTLDITDQRMHHEIYLSDARKVAPEKLKTVVRHPIKTMGE